MGKLLSYDGLISDITERKIAQDELVAANERMKKLLADLTKSHDELKAAQSQLIQAEKLHSVGQLAAGVAHEVKNPLQVLLVGLEYLGGCPLGQEESAQSVIKEMTEAIRRADEVIQGLLDFASPRDLGMQPGSLNAVIEQSLKFVKHDLTKAGIKLVRKLQSDLPPVLLDPTKMEQVFINLLTNACHAMTQGGSLTVSTSRRTMSAEEARHQAGDRSGIRLRGGDEVVVAQVRDQGNGIREEHLPKIFEPFFTTKSTGHGTGLGLPVTKTIVDLHKGEISIANNPDGGVTVTLIFKAHIQKNPIKGETS
jgi:signal transduction histidine kinase